MEEDRPSGRGRAETSRIAKKDKRRKTDKMNGDRGAALRGPIVTQPITSMRRKDRGI